MSYKKATQILPQELLIKVQEYIDGEFLYIPEFQITKRTGEPLLQHVKNCMTETRVFILTTFLDKAWIF